MKDHYDLILGPVSALFSTAYRPKLGPEITFMLDLGDLLGTTGSSLGSKSYFGTSLALFSTAYRPKPGPETTFMLDLGDYWVLLGHH